MVRVRIARRRTSVRLFRYLLAERGPQPHSAAGANHAAFGVMVAKFRGERKRGGNNPGWDEGEKR